MPGNVCRNIVVLCAWTSVNEYFFAGSVNGVPDFEIQREIGFEIKFFTNLAYDKVDAEKQQYEEKYVYNVLFHSIVGY